MTLFSIKDICEKIWELEDQYHLLEFEAGGVLAWQITRMNIYYAIASKTGTFHTPHSEKIPHVDRIKSVFSFGKNLLSNPFGNFKKTDILVFDHARKIPIDGEYIDIYTKYLTDSFKDSNWEVFESAYQGKHLSRPAENIHYLDYITLVSHGIMNIVPYRFKPDENATLGIVEKEINEHFGIEFNLKKLLAKEITAYRINYSYYRKLLDIKKPSVIYLVVSYSFYKKSLIGAAKDLGIQTVELQHGTLSRYHLGYSFPGKIKKIKHFPDKFFSFGSYWNTAADFPIGPEDIVVKGFSHFRSQKNNYQGINRIPNQILVISQGAIGKELSEFAVSLARKLPDFRIIYKLHPGEYSLWKKDYKILSEGLKLNNFIVVDSSDTPLYQFFAESEITLGVFSTALFEALGFGCKIFIADLPGIEYMLDLIESGEVIRVKTPENMIRLLNESISETSKLTFF
ncbi:MAG: hypothetical protein JXR95_07585 [Deltaproteobacteria bacterium]|nr:hypothetical protein [Deltaproteobacteria bacterium]